MKNRFGCLDLRTPCKVVFYTNSRMVGAVGNSTRPDI
jgi:hypothetical protein